jgi:hypothetical protein
LNSFKLLINIKNRCDASSSVGYEEGIGVEKNIPEPSTYAQLPEMKSLCGYKIGMAYLEVEAFKKALKTPFLG